MNTGEYINLLTDTLEESNPHILIRNVCPLSGKKLELTALKSNFRVS